MRHGGKCGGRRDSIRGIDLPRARDERIVPTKRKKKKKRKTRAPFRQRRERAERELNQRLNAASTLRDPTRATFPSFRARARARLIKIRSAFRRREIYRHADGQRRNYRPSAGSFLPLCEPRTRPGATRRARFITDFSRCCDFFQFPLPSSHSLSPPSRERPYYGERPRPHTLRFTFRFSRGTCDDSPPPRPPPSPRPSRHRCNAVT